MDSDTILYWSLQADMYIMESCFKFALNSSIFLAVLFLQNGETVNTLPTMTLISAFRRSRIQLIRSTLITTKKGILSNAFFKKIKEHRRIAMHFEKLACRFLAFIHLAAALLWLA